MISIVKNIYIYISIKYEHRWEKEATIITIHREEERKKEEEERAGRESTDCSVYLAVVKSNGLACLNAEKNTLDTSAMVFNV